METFIITFLMMLVCAGIMSLGVLVKGKAIEGSCGGIANLGLKKVCDCENPCEKKQARIQAEENKRLDIINKHRIL